MGNSYYHHFVYDLLRAYPGLVTLHDYCLAGFHHGHAGRLAPDRAHDAFARELEHNHPTRACEVLEDLDRLALEDGGVHEALTRRGLSMNRRIFEHARRVVVHSPWCRDQVRATLPTYHDRTAFIPLGASPRVVEPARRGATRSRYGLPADALIVASFGILHESKLNLESVTAFRPLAEAHPNALLVFVGQDLTGGAVRAHAESLGLGAHVRFLGRPCNEDFENLLDVADIGLALRRPPTNGETSAALIDLLRSGVATIVNDVGTFGDYPDQAVCKISWGPTGDEQLSRALLDLASNPQARATLGNGPGTTLSVT